MKPKYLLLIFLVIPLVLAQTAELNRNEFSRGDTIILDINSKYPFNNELTNVNLHMLSPYGKEIAAPFYVSKLTDSKYIAYMTIPDTYTGSTYTLRIDNIYYVKDGVVEHFVQNKEFTIKTQSKTLSVDPGGVYVDLNENQNFYLNLKNTGSEKLSIKLTYGIDYFDVPETEFEINPGDYKKLNIKVKQAGENIITVAYDEGRLDYQIKVYGGGQPVVEQIPIVLEDNALIFSNIEGKLVKYLDTGERYEGVLKVKNQGIVKLTNIKISKSTGLYGFVTLSPEYISTINSGEEKQFLIKINEDGTLNKDYEGMIVLESDEGAKLELPVSLYYQETAKTIIPKENESKEVIPEPPLVVDLDEQEKGEVALGVILSLVAILFVLAVSLVIFFKLRKADSRKKKKF